MFLIYEATAVDQEAYDKAFYTFYLEMMKENKALPFGDHHYGDGDYGVFPHIIPPASITVPPSSSLSKPDGN
jgi:hypothetical protein